MKEGWETKPLGDLLDVQNGYAFESKQFASDAGVPLIRIRDLRGAVSTETRYNGEYDPRYLVEAGDLLIGMDGEFRCYEWMGAPALLNQRVCRLQIHATGLAKRFLLYGINSYLADIESKTGFTTVKHLSSKSISSIGFPLPPLPEQQRIVGILDEAFEKLAIAKANTEKNLQNAQDLFESQLGSSYAKYCLHHECVALETLIGSGVVKLGRGKIISKRDLQMTPGAYPVYSSARENDGKFGEYGLFMFDEDLITWSVDGGGRLFYRPRHRFSVTNVGGFLRILRNDKLDYRYLHLVLTHLHSTLRFDWVRKAHPSVIRKLYDQIPLAPIPDQRAFVASLDAIEGEVARLQDAYRAKGLELERLRESLLRQAFAGEL